ncbi:MAG TPA: septum formation initiator family protein [Candidatus Binataceae bacterium]|nr:septum formation initiator family protein [Candidatus Binataceae bacterium]
MTRAYFTVGGMYRLARHLRREWLSLILGTVLILLAGSAFLGPQGPRDLLVLRARRTQLETAHAELIAQQTALTTAIQKLGSDDRYVEHAVRRELGYARPDELIYKFADPTRTTR